MPYEFHPLANLFPLMEGDDFVALVADVKANGVHDPIDLYQGKILDGRNRYRAAEAAEIELETRNFRYFRPEFYGDPLAYVTSKNLARRHLNESQRALVAAKIARLGQGARTDLSPIGEKSQSERAHIMSVGKRSVERADDVVDRAAPEIVRAVGRGKLSISAAARAAMFDAHIQQSIAAKAEAGQENAARNEIKRNLRQIKETALGERQWSLPDKKYGVILADPEWRFEPWSRETGMDRAADNHYPTSCLEVIASRDVASIAAPDCVLFLWATAPMLPHALLVMAAWGFNYCSNYVWAKDRIGTGYWNRNKHEHLLIGTKGKIPAPAMGTQWESLIAAPLGAHSAKPEIFHEMIEAYFPTLPKIELNRRGPPREGWDAWGNESESEHDPETGEIISSSQSLMESHP
jgi:N6-adenosine-specific RNA methylase IME4